MRGKSITIYYSCTTLIDTMRIANYTIILFQRQNEVNELLCLMRIQSPQSHGCNVRNLYGCDFKLTTFLECKSNDTSTTKSFAEKEASKAYQYPRYRYKRDFKENHFSAFSPLYVHYVNKSLNSNFNVRQIWFHCNFSDKQIYINISGYIFILKLNDFVMEHLFWNNQ